MADRRNVSSSLSAGVIEYLRRRGNTQAQIAQMLHVSEGFISLVKSRERSLTLDHLVLLSDHLGVPLGALMLAASEPAKGSGDAKQLAELSARIMEKADAARQQILKGPSRSSSRKSA